jgi:hypothetical protein
MLDWDDCLNFIKGTPTDCSEASVERLEFAVSHYYCQAFTIAFGQKRVVPRRLPYRSRTRETPARAPEPVPGTLQFSFDV